MAASRFDRDCGADPVGHLAGPRPRRVDDPAADAHFSSRCNQRRDGAATVSLGPEHVDPGDDSPAVLNYLRNVPGHRQHWLYLAVLFVDDPARKVLRKGGLELPELLACHQVDDGPLLPLRKGQRPQVLQRRIVVGHDEAALFLELEALACPFTQLAP